MNTEEPIFSESRLAIEDRHDIGGEEFSEKIYDENAPLPEEFSEPHNISATGAKLTDESA